MRDLQDPKRTGDWYCDHCGRDTETLTYETAKGVYWSQCVECGELKTLIDPHHH